MQLSLLILLLAAALSGCDDDPPVTDCGLDCGPDAEAGPDADEPIEADLDIEAELDIEADLDAEAPLDAEALPDAEADHEQPPRPCESAASCNNGRNCDGLEQCVDGLCAPGTAPDCDDGDECTTDACSNVREGCRHILLVIDEDGDGVGGAVCRGLDCDDTDPAVHPGARERCDGADDDCNGRVDEPASLVVSDESTSPAEPTLVWTGEAYALAWSDDRDGDRELYLALLSADGERVEATSRITTSPGLSESPALAWTGDGLSLVWSDDRSGEVELYAQRLSPEGELLGGPAQLTGSGLPCRYPALAWTGARLALAWVEDGGATFSLRLALLDPEGGLVEGPLAATDALNILSRPTLLWTGAELALAWSDIRSSDGEVYLARFSAGAARLADDAVVDSDAFLSSRPSLVWVGDGYLVAWSDQRSGDHDLYLARTAADGTPLGEASVLVDTPGWSQAPVVAWAGASLAVAFRDNRSGADETYWAVFDAAGEALVSPQQVSDAPGWTMDPAIVSDGRGVALAWVQLGLGWGVRLARSCRLE